MLTIDLKSRMKNKTFWVAIASAIVLLIQQLGFRDLIPSNWLDIVNTSLSILVMLGIVVDTSTPGISDQVISNVTVAATSENTKQEVQAEASTTAINSDVSEDSQGTAEEIETKNVNIPR